MITKQEKPLLSIGMIVKNEERCLERCLKALQPLREQIPSELVIADTGSVDATKKIAKAYGDEVFDFPWINDFSAARNAVMDRCRGKWFLTIDADEYLDPDFQQLTDFLLEKGDTTVTLGIIVQRNYFSREMKAGQYKDFYALRMVRMDVGLRYVGSIHETWPITGKEAGKTFDQVILHHDGYAGDEAEAEAAKRSRNLSLLEEELKKDPKDLRRVVQCLQSSSTPEQEKKYAQMAVSLAEEKSWENWQEWGPVAFRDAVSRALKNDFPEFEEWVEKGRNLFPQSIHIQVDVPLCCASYLIQKKRPKEALLELERYWQGIKVYEAANFERRQLQLGALFFLNRWARQKALFMELHGLGELQRWEELWEKWSVVSLTEVEDFGLLDDYFQLMKKLWREAKRPVGSVLRREWVNLAQDQESSDGKERWERFSTLCRKAFETEDGTGERQEEQNIFRLFAEAFGEETLLGIGGLVMESDSPEQSERLLEKLSEQGQDWGEVPSSVLGHVIALGAKLPESFYREKAEVLEQHARAVALYLREKNLKPRIFAAHQRVAEVSRQEPFSPGEVFWEFCLAKDRIEVTDWEKNASISLWEAFCQSSQRYLQTFFQEEVQKEEWISLLPPVVRFGWYCGQAQEARTREDSAEYLHWLRKGLQAFPKMKELVSFLIVEGEKIQVRKQVRKASKELMELAEKIQGILAQYEPEDPAVLELKASPAYRMVADLLEGKGKWEN